MLHNPEIMKKKMMKKFEIQKIQKIEIIFIKLPKMFSTMIANEYLS